MRILLKNATIFKEGKFEQNNIEIENDTITNISLENNEMEFEKVYDLKGKYIFPGLIDVHTHLREPGFEYKETIKNGLWIWSLHGMYM